MSDLGGNPFALLFPSLETAEKYSSEHRAVASSSGDKSGQPESLPGLSDSQVEQIQKLNAAIQRIFLITLNKFSVLAGECEHLVYLSQLADSIGSHNQSWLDVETLEQALFERLMLDNPGDHVIQADTTKSDAPNFVTENRLVYYLNSCYSRCDYELEKRSSHDTDMVNNLEKVQNIIVQNLVTAVIEPQLYFNQNIQALHNTL